MSDDEHQGSSIVNVPLTEEWTDIDRTDKYPTSMISFAHRRDANMHFLGLRLEQENADSDGYSFLALKAGEFVFTTSELFSEEGETLYPDHKPVYYGQVFLMQVDRPSKDLADTNDPFSRRAYVAGIPLQQRLGPKADRAKAGGAGRRKNAGGSKPAAAVGGRAGGKGAGRPPKPARPGSRSGGAAAPTPAPAHKRSSRSAAIDDDGAAEAEKSASTVQKLELCLDLGPAATFHTKVVPMSEVTNVRAATAEEKQLVQARFYEGCSSGQLYNWAEEHATAQHYFDSFHDADDVQQAAIAAKETKRRMKELILPSYKSSAKRSRPNDAASKLEEALDQLADWGAWYHYHEFALKYSGVTLTKPPEPPEEVDVDISANYEWLVAIDRVKPMPEFDRTPSKNSAGYKTAKPARSTGSASRRAKATRPKATPATTTAQLTKARKTEFHAWTVWGGKAIARMQGLEKLLAKSNMKIHLDVLPEVRLASAHAITHYPCGEHAPHARQMMLFIHPSPLCAPQAPGEPPFDVEARKPPKLTGGKHLLSSPSSSEGSARRISPLRASKRPKA